MKIYFFLFFLILHSITGVFALNKDSEYRSIFGVGLHVRPSKMNKSSETPYIQLTFAYSSLNWLKVEPFFGYIQSSKKSGLKRKVWNAGTGIYYLRTLDHFNLYFGIKTGYCHSFERTSNSPIIYDNEINRVSYFVGPASGFEYRINTKVGIGVETFFYYSDISIKKKPIAYPYKDQFEKQISLEGNLTLHYYF